MPRLSTNGNGFAGLAKALGVAFAKAKKTNAGPPNGQARAYGACPICETEAPRRLRILKHGASNIADLEAIPQGTRCWACGEWWRRRVNQIGADEEAHVIAQRPGAINECDALDLKAAEAPEQLETLPLLEQPGYVLKGLANVLSAPPKCGKTEVTYFSMPTWLAQGERVLYFTEEPERVWQRRLIDCDIIDRHGLTLVFGLGADVEKQLSRAREGDESVVVIDTLRGLGVLGDDENDNASVARRLEPWLMLCRERRKTLVGLVHDRKSGGKHGQGVSGAHALVGAVDMLLQLRHGKNENERLVSALGRLVQPPLMRYERQADGTMRVLDAAAAAAPPAAKPKTRPWPELIQMLPDRPPGITLEAFVGKAQVSNKTALAALGQPTVAKTGGGKKGDPFLYWRGG